MSVVANGGYFYRPTLLKRSRNRETGEVKTYTTDVNGKITIDPVALEQVRSALAGVVAEPGGTAHSARTPLASVAGKTGTAQVIAQKVAGRKLSGKTGDHAWFVAYAPSGPGKKAKVAVGVMLVGAGAGGETAAPAASGVLATALQRSH